MGIALLVGSAAQPAAAQTTPLVGSLHEHSGYSDGWPGSRPQTYFESGKGFGLDFMGSARALRQRGPPDRRERLLHRPDGRAAHAPSPTRSTRSTRFASGTRPWSRRTRPPTPTFTAFRGFEWTSDRFGHINVYFSKHDANAKGDGGYATMDSFYSWLNRAPTLGGGGDGIATFNHPGAKSLSSSDPGFNWNDFAYVPAADDRMVGIETFNDRTDYAGPGKGGGYPEGAYAHALDKGWHVGAIGAEDLGHKRTDDWGGPSRAKTVILANGRSEWSLKAAMQARRFYAVRTPGVRLTFALDGRPMGARISPTEGQELKVKASVNDPTAKLELVTSHGAVVATGIKKLSVVRPAASGERWYFVRASRAGEPIAYSSPVWVTTRPATGPDGGEWLAGDLHVHTCYSHDAYCPPNDDNTGPDEFYTLGLSPGARFLEASARGLDYLAITDHNNLRSASDPDFGSNGVIGIPAYENSLHGHAQMLRASRIYDNGDSSAAAVNAAADALRADGGVFQINHPSGDIEQRFDNCSDTAALDWQYGYDVRPDTIEVWNVASSIQFAETYWECWLQRGNHIGATGGSDSHWLSTLAVQGVGNPDHVGVRARPDPRRNRRGDRRGPHDDLTPAPKPGRRAAAARGRRRRQRRLRVGRRRHSAARHADARDRERSRGRRHRARARERRDPAGAAGHAGPAPGVHGSRQWRLGAGVAPAARGRGRASRPRAASPTASSPARVPTTRRSAGSPRRFTSRPD